MANDEIEVEYDTSGVNIPSNNTEGFSNNLSEYLYPKLPYVENDDGNGNAEFSEDDIEDYGLDVTDNKINISTTHKLIKYLKSYVKKSVIKTSLSLRSEFNNMISGINTSLENMITEADVDAKINTVVTNFNRSLNDKSTIGHVHDIEDITYLNNKFITINNAIESKANTSDLTNHVNNKNNPHNVTLEQLGYNDKVYIKRLHSRFYLFRRGNVVQLIVDNWDGKSWVEGHSDNPTDTWKKWYTIFDIPDGYRPVDWDTNNVVQSIYCPNLFGEQLRIRIRLHDNDIRIYYDGGAVYNNFYGTVTWITGDGFDELE